MIKNRKCYNCSGNKCGGILVEGRGAVKQRKKGDYLI
jgi:hypothetical protein